MSRRLLVTDALLVEVTGEPHVRPEGWLLAEDGVIVDTGYGRPPAAGPGTEVVDAGGAFVGPGFVSSHSHLFTSVARGLGADETLYGWADAMYSVSRDADPEDVYWAAAHGAFDSICSGVTTVFDFIDSRRPWVSMREDGPEPALRPPAYVHRQVDAHADAGVRGVMAVKIEGVESSRDRAWDEFAEAVAYIRGGDRRYLLDAAVYGAAQWARDEQLAVLEAEAMRRFGLVNQAHLLETREQIEAQWEKFAWYERAGALGPDMIFGHFVHPTDHIVEACAHYDCAVSWQPVANGRLASGTAQVSTLRARGIRVGLGLDDQACSDVSDPWQNMRFGLYQQRATDRSTELSVGDVLRMQTLGAAEIIGVEDRVGSLEPGKYADFLVVDPRRPDLGPLRDPLASYVLSVGQRNLRSVYVGGELAADDGVATSALAAEASRHVHRRFAPAAPAPVPA